MEVSVGLWLFIGILILFAIRAIAQYFYRQKNNQKDEQTSSAGNDSERAWHNLDTAKLFDTLNTCDQGLSLEAVNQRIDKYGLNVLPVTKPRSLLVRFLLQFHNVLIYVLLLAAVGTALLGHWVDASVILGVVLINAIIGLIQEGKAEDALLAIKKMLSPSAMVVRGGSQLSIPAEQLVPGDIVLLQSGDKVPADLRLFRVKGLQIQEAALTGESLAVEKHTDTVKLNTVIGDRTCMAFSGTLVTHGQGSGVVVETGSGTEIGLISSLVADVDSVTTPLLRQMDQFGRWLTVAILLIAVANFIFGVLIRNYAAAEMFLASVSLAVAAIPEGLPAIMTITLAIGVQRMASRNAIIRRLPAVETLGAVSVICSDKTGTLTRNEMTVAEIATARDLFDISGAGYDPHGVITLGGRSVEVEQRVLLEEMLHAAVLCNDTSLIEEDGQWKVHGDPMEGALHVAGMKANLDIELLRKNYPRTDLIPFESEHKFMATLHHSHRGDAFVYVKGAPEQLLNMCCLQRTRTGDLPVDSDYWQQRINNMASGGQRVLAIAIKPVEADRLELNFDDVESGLVLLGLFGLIDPPREEAIEAVKVCHAAGIRVKMMTGDHGETARAIARQLNFVNVDDILTGQDLIGIDEESLREKVTDIDVYARVSPEHKLNLVRLLQDQGLTVAMTGDGVNDAPALKRADVGTAMGHNGTEAAKEASEMVLADDNFASIAHAVEEGRTVYDNLKKAILFILPTNGGEALVILAAVLMGFQYIPLTPVQILWVNMITAVTLALSLAFEPAERQVMSRPPRKPREPMLNRHLVWRVIFVSFILMAGTFGLFLWEMQHGSSIEYARTVAVNTLVMFEIFYLFNSRYITESVFSFKGFFGNRYVLYAIGLLLIFQLAFTYLPPLQMLFGTAAIDAQTWLLIVTVSSSVLFLVELEKKAVRYLENRASTS